MKKIQNKIKGGISLIGVLVLAFILILVLGYYNISIRSVVENPTTQDNIHYVTGNSRNLWDDYLKVPVTNFWNNVVVNIFWASFINNMERVRDGQPTNIEQSAPSTNFINN